jgi:hypothetical protein
LSALGVPVEEIVTRRSGGESRGDNASMADYDAADRPERPCQ